MVFAGWQFLAMAAVFLAARWVAWPARRFMRVGLALMAVFLAGIVAIGGRGHGVGGWVYPLGWVAGLGYGAYWMGLYTAALRETGAGDRDRFNGNMGAAEASAGLVGPLAGASLIRWAGGFLTVFAVSLAGLAPSWLLVRRVGGLAEPPEHPGPPAAGPRWRRLMGAMAARGAYEGLLMTAPGLLLFETSGSAARVGAFASLVAAAQLAGSHWAGRAHGIRARSLLAWGGAALLTLASALLGRLPLALGLWGYGAAAGVAVPLQKVPVEAWSLDLIGGLSMQPRQATAVKELVLNGARALGLLMVGLMLVGARDVLGLTRMLLVLPVPALGVAILLTPRGWPALRRPQRP